MDVPLSSGYNMPLIGMGTGNLNENTAHIIESGLKLGYRHIDTAYMYGVESSVGEGVRTAIAKGYVKGREDVFITSKLWASCFRSDLVKPAVRESLKNLAVGYLDLCLVHMPFATKQATLEEISERENNEVRFSTHWKKDSEGQIMLSDVSYLEAWRELEECVQEGLIRSIGLSNFNSVQIQDVIDHARVKPCVNQVECNPYLAQVPLVKFCHERGIIVTAYAPLGGPFGNNSLHDDQIMKVIANKYAKTPAQVALRFNFQRGIPVIPKTCSEERLKENYDILDFILSKEEMAKIIGLDKGLRQYSLEMCRRSKQFPFNLPF